MPCIFHTPEPALIQAGIPELAVEALNKDILGSLAGLNEAQLDTSFAWPREQCLAGELRTVVTHTSVLGGLRVLASYQATKQLDVPRSISQQAV